MAELLTMKQKEETQGVSAQDNLYDGCITDVAIDGSVDHRGRPADKATTGRHKAISTIMVSVLLERMAFYGISFNLVSYLTLELHEGAAVSITNVWNWGGVAWILPLLGGFIADAYLGRFKTILCSLVIYLMGMTLLTLTVSIRALKPPECPTQTNCKHASELQVGLFYFALYIVALGAGGYKPCISTLGADQFDEEDEKERPMKQSFFNYWWVAVTGGSFFAVTALVYIEDHVGFNWGYGIPTVGLIISIGAIILGMRNYRYKRPQGSPLTQVAQVLVAAIRKYRVRVPVDPSLLHEIVQPGKRNVLHTDHIRFLDKAATPNPKAGQESKWELCTVTQVEEIKLLVRVMPIWVTTLIFIVTTQQLSTVFLSQGLTMNLSMGPHFNIPPASLEVTTTITALVCIPLYDLFLVPCVRRFTGNERGFSLLQRIGIGLVISILGMAVSAIVEIKRLKLIHDDGLQNTTAPLPISVFWLTPQYFIMGVAQVFAWMGMLEFFYDQVPDDMQSIGAGLFTSNTGVAHFLCTAIVNIVKSATTRGGHQAWIAANINKSRLDKYYWMLTILSAVNFVAFFAVSMWYTYKGTQRYTDHKKVVPEVAPPVTD